MVKNPLANEGDIRDAGSILGWEDPPEDSMATQSSTLVWRTHGQRNLMGYSS